MSITEGFRAVMRSGRSGKLRHAEEKKASGRRMGKDGEGRLDKLRRPTTPSSPPTLFFSPEDFWLLVSSIFSASSS